jgi:outer membrane protein OmpA-like peptidoglycan-associated protein
MTALSPPPLFFDEYAHVVGQVCENLIRASSFSPPIKNAWKNCGDCAKKHRGACRHSRRIGLKNFPPLHTMSLVNPLVEMRHMKKFAVVVAITALLLAGCQTENAYTGEQQTSKSTQGAVIGGLAGAIIGALANTGGKTSQTALIGGAVGALAGGMVGQYMDNQEAELRQHLRTSGVGVRRDGDDIVLVIRNDILFKVNSSDLDPQAIRTIASVAEVLRHYDKTLIDVNGYTDTTGSYDYNMELSRKRAESVATVLADNGVASGRISPSGFGKTHLAVQTGDNVNEPRNRRVEIRIVPHRGES